jgi:16S rRNA (guanine966-N2)-methyltransferase
MAIFSILSNRVNGSIVLDLFCGSGALGIEAISRGAAFCTFVDYNISNFKLNINLLDKSCFNYIEGDIFKIIDKIGKVYDIIFVDPPYGQYNCQNVLDIIAINELIKYNGIIIYEESAKKNISVDENRFKVVKEKNYGDTKIYVIEVKNGNIVPRDI